MVAGPDAGPLICRGALPAASCARWLAALGTAGPSRPLSTLTTQPAPSVQSVHSADVTHPAPDSRELITAVANSPLRAPIEARLGPAPRCNLSQSWVRHGRPPHHWHQDGALRFDFLAHAGRSQPADALLEMLTCWIALTPCGEDAPGLEWVAEPISHLLLPPKLTDIAVHEAYRAQSFVHPSLEPGDALLFDGTLLHRTHLTPQMALPRTSLELRFFRADEWPARVARDAWAELG